MRYYQEVDLLEWILQWAPQVEFYAFAPDVCYNMFRPNAARTNTSEAIVVGGLSAEFFSRAVKPTLTVEFSWCEFKFFDDLEILYIPLNTPGECYVEILSLARQLGIRVDSRRHGKIIPEERWAQC
jgi:hypothetical protein